MLAEYALHPIELQVTKAYSPASIGKAYLQAMGVTPIMARMPDFPKRYCGYAESAFFGGRASAHVRNAPVPVVYLDVISQYFHGECADGAVGVHDGAGGSTWSWKTPRRSAQTSCEA